MNARERRDIKRARSHGTSFGIRTERMINNVERTTIWTRLDIAPKEAHSYHDGHKRYASSEVVRRIVKAPGSRLILPKQ